MIRVIAPPCIHCWELKRTHVSRAGKRHCLFAPTLYERLAADKVWQLFQHMYARVNMPPHHRIDRIHFHQSSNKRTPWFMDVYATFNLTDIYYQADCGRVIMTYQKVFQ